MRLKGKVAVITGAARGLGAAFAVGFGKEGANVVIGDIRDGAKTVAAVQEAGGKAVYVKMDVTKQDQCDALAKAAMDNFGAVDILVNNAGVLVTIKPFMEVTTEEWMEIMATNTLGPFHCTKAVFPYMKDRGGKIINIASATIFEGVPGLPHYISSKGAVMAFTRGMAREWGDYKINVNAICPGGIETDLVREQAESEAQREGISVDKAKQEVFAPAVERTPLARLAMPEEVASVVAFLASSEAGWITGQSINVDGGLTP